jgi:hypothetical protein
MKAKLIKVLDQYHLYNGDKAIATTIVGNPMLLPSLSKQNCDEIFGIVDVEKLAEEITKEYATLTPKAFKRGVALGINKAMELNKDKVFTIEDMKRGCSLIFLALGDGGDITTDEVIESVLSIKQPTEIEVEIMLMKDNEWYEKYQGTPPRHFKIQHNQPFDGDLPKLDSEGCLILKKI